MLTEEESVERRKRKRAEGEVYEDAPQQGFRVLCTVKSLDDSFAENIPLKPLQIALPAVSFFGINSKTRGNKGEKIQL